MGCAVDDVVGLDRRGPVAIVTIRRPERMNALNREVFVRLGLFFRRVKAWLGEPYVQREFERELEAFLKAFEKGGAEKRIERLLS